VPTIRLPPFPTQLVTLAMALAAKMEGIRQFLNFAHNLKFGLLFLFFLFYNGDRDLLTPAVNFNRAKGSKGKGVVVRVYIVRHGETQENREGVIQGQQDTFLNAIGLEQAKMVGEALKDAKLGIAFSSDLSRAVKVRGHLIR